MQTKIKSVMVALMAVTLTFTFSSCGSKPENAIKEQINLMNQFADEYAKDPKSDKLAKIEEKIFNVGERMKSFEDLSQSEAKKLAEKYQSEMSEASEKYMKAKMGSAMGNMGKMMEGFNFEGLGK